MQPHKLLSLVLACVLATPVLAAITSDSSVIANNQFDYIIIGGNYEFLYHAVGLNLTRITQLALLVLHSQTACPPTRLSLSLSLKQVSGTVAFVYKLRLGAHNFFL